MEERWDYGRITGIIPYRVCSVLFDTSSCDNIQSDLCNSGMHYFGYDCVWCIILLDYISMIEILMIITYLSGVEVTLSASRMYGVKTMEECVGVIPTIQNRFAGASSISCAIGDILEKGSKT